MTGHRHYGCAHCPEIFTNPVKLGGHVHAQHPEHRRRITLPRTAFTPLPRRPRTDGGLKRDTDTWPGKP